MEGRVNKCECCYVGCKKYAYLAWTMEHYLVANAVVAGCHVDVAALSVQPLGGEPI